MKIIIGPLHSLSGKTDEFIMKSFWLSVSLGLLPFTDHCSKSLVTCIWPWYLSAPGIATTLLSKSIFSLTVDWLILSFNRIKLPWFDSSLALVCEFEFPFERLGPILDAKVGMIRTISGLRQGVVAHTMARLTSMADQYAVGPLYHVMSMGWLATSMRTQRRITDTMTTLCSCEYRMKNW